MFTVCAGHYSINIQIFTGVYALMQIFLYISKRVHMTMRISLLKACSSEGSWYAVGGTTGGGARLCERTWTSLAKGCTDLEIVMSCRHDHAWALYKWRFLQRLHYLNTKSTSDPNLKPNRNTNSCRYHILLLTMFTSPLREACCIALNFAVSRVQGCQWTEHVATL